MMQRFVRRIALAATALALVAAPAFAQSAFEGWHGKAQPPQYKGQIFPPWQHGLNNDALHRGLEFTVPEADALADFHGDITNPKLVLYVGGNYFFAMAHLVKAFEDSHPAFKGRIYWETIPPGLLERQMDAGGTITSGNMTWTAKPDAYFAGLGRVKAMIKKGKLVGPAVPYVTNTLTIMVPEGNPAKITSLKDLAKPGVKLVMPNPEFEGIGKIIEKSLVKAGGKALLKTVYTDKVKAGSTILTHIHHRQSPLFLMQGLADAGVTWQSEAMFQEQVHHPISHVDIPASENTTAIYAGAIVKGAPHLKAAKAWLAFIRSPKSLAIFESYGFKPYKGKMQ